MSNFYKRLFLSFLIFSYLFFSGWVVSAEEKVKLRLKDIPEKRAISISEKAELAVYEEFLRKNPDIEIIKVTGITLPGDLQQGPGDLMAMAGGVAPDVLELYLRKTQSYLDQNFLYPLDEYITEEYVKSIGAPRQLWPVAMRGGHYYAAVKFHYIMGLIYRKDLFKEAGLPDRPPKDWDELFEFAQRLTFPKKKVKKAKIQRGQMGLALPMGYNGGWVFTNFVWQAGGDMVHQYKVCPRCRRTTEAKKEIEIEKCKKCGHDLSKTEPKWKVVIAQEPGIRALEFYKKLRWTKWFRDPETNKLVSLPEDGSLSNPITGQKIDKDKVITGVLRTEVGLGTEELLKGEVAMCISTIEPQFLEEAAKSGIRPDQIGFASLPAGPTGIRANFIGGNCLGINSTQKDKRSRDAAWRYIKFMCGDEAKRITTRVYVENGWAHLVPPRLLKKFGYDEQYNEIPKQLIAAYEDVERNGRVEPYCKNYQNVQTTELQVPIDKVFTNENANPEKLLKSQMAKVNRHLMGVKPKKEMQRKRLIGGVIILIVGLGVIIAFFFILKELSEKYKVYREEGGAKRLRRGAHITAWVFMLPALLTIVLWQYVPLLRGSVMAFFDYRLLGGGPFLGIDNFIEAFTDPFFYKVLFNTLYYVVLTLAIGFCAPIALALLLSEVPRGKMLFRTLFYLPAVTTGLVIMFLWKDLMFEPSPAGFLNQLIGYLGLSPQQWLQDPKIAMLCIIIPGVWAGVGPGSIIYLAALKTVSDEWYEAADLDGATVWHKIWHITLPTLKPLIIINFVGAFIGSFHAMQNIFVMTGGGPANATRVIGIEIWANAFLYLKFGYATAMAWILGSMLIGFTMYQLRILKEVEFVAGGKR